MENGRNTDKLAGYVIKLGGLAIILALCFYFKNVLVYIIAAFVVSLIGRPIMQLLRKINIKKRHLPDWLLAVLTIIFIIGFLVLIVTQMIPLVSNIIRDASAIQTSSYFESNPIEKLNEWLIGLFPNLDQDFDITAVLLTQLKELVDFGKVSGIVTRSWRSSKSCRTEAGRSTLARSWRTCRSASASPMNPTPPP